MTLFLTVTALLIASFIGGYLVGSKYPIRSAADSLLRSVDELIKKKQ